MGYEKQLKDISEINRALGVIEWLTYAIQDDGVANGLIDAVTRIEAVVNKENEDA